MNDISRRGLMRKGALTTAAAVGVGAGANHAGYSPVGRAKALAPLIGAVGATTGLSYLAYKYKDEATDLLDLDLGDTRDYGGYSDASILHEEIRLGGLEMRSADERVMASINNNITNSQNVALTKGKAAIIEAMNNGKSETEAQTAMQNKIDDYYTTIQKNLLTHHDEQIRQIRHFYNTVKDHPNLTVKSVFSVSTQDGSGDGTSDWDLEPGYENTKYAQDVTLLDGSTKTYQEHMFANSSNGKILIGFLGKTDLSSYSYAWKVSTFHIIDPTDGQSTLHGTWSWTGYDTAWSAIKTERDNVNSDLSGFVTDVYSNWDVDEIPTSDLVDPITAATEFGQDYDNTSMRSAQAAMLGIPTQDARSLTLEVHTDGDSSTDGTIVKADLFTSHVPTDGSGNEIGFSTGNVYEPSTWTEPAFVAYESQETDSDGVITDSNKEFVELAKPFEVIEATALDGSTVDSFKVEETNNQTAQVSELRNEIDQLNQTLADQREKQEQQATGGGGFLAGSNIGTPGLLAAGGAVLLAAFGLSGGG